jgi:hypothetical protein
LTKQSTVCAAVVLTVALAPLGRAEELGVAPAGTLGQIPHVAGEAKVDGVLDEAIWAQALVVDLAVETQPRENVRAEFETKVYLVENGSELLVAFDARDPEPESIRAYLRDSDAAWNDDWIGIILDTFNDERRAFEFFANPLGVQMDAVYDETNRNENEAWDAIWDSAGRITEQGYIVEVSIPFSQLRFPRLEGEHTWGIDLIRVRPRNVRTRTASGPQDRNRGCYACQFRKVHGFVNAEPSSALEIVPSLTSTRTDTRPATAGASFTDGDFDHELGLGVRWGITPDITADLAINPDFSQIEADVAQLEENTQFAVFYPESRPFFLESADYYDSPLPVVFTRTVADPDVGAKITGRSGQNTFGAFANADAVTNLLFPGPLGSTNGSLDESNDAIVARYTRGFGNASTVGALFTSRSGDGYRNETGGVDGRYRINDQNSVRFQYLDSRTEYPADVAAEFAQPLGELRGDALRLEYLYSSRNWYARYWHQELDPEFRADSGFITRVDLEQDNLEQNHTWIGSGGWWTEMRAGLRWNDARTQSGQMLARSAQPFFSFNGPWQSFMQITAGPQQEYWNGQVFDLDNGFVFAQFRPASGVVIWFQGRLGEALDYANSRVGDQHRIQPQLEWNMTRHLLLRMRYTSDRLSSKTGPTIYKAELTDVRVTWQFNVRSFVRFTWQGEDTKRNLSLYDDPTTDPSTSTRATEILYSYKVNPQTVLFAGYANNASEDETTGALEPTGRTLFFKVSYAWHP